jgi:hypothetical protein
MTLNLKITEPVQNDDIFQKVKPIVSWVSVVYFFYYTGVGYLGSGLFVFSSKSVKDAWI